VAGAPRMTDTECITFLHWALPQLRLRWAGFRRVRRQVCKRISRRIAELDLPGTAAYRDHLEHNPLEWPVLDGLCSITISRFYSPCLSANCSAARHSSPVMERVEGRIIIAVAIRQAQALKM
jgi:hypothetical protein